LVCLFWYGFEQKAGKHDLKMGDWLLTEGVDLVVSENHHGGNWHVWLITIYSWERGLCGGDGSCKWHE
jgi:hypothetical protein